MEVVVRVPEHNPMNLVMGMVDSSQEEPPLFTVRISLCLIT